MRGWPLTYEDFSGGLNTQGGLYLDPGNQCRAALNVHTSLTGDIEKRFGYVTHSGSTLTGAPVNAKVVHSLFPVNTATKSLIGVTTTATTDTIFKLTTVGGTASVLKTGLTANTRWHFAQAEVNASAGPIFGMNGVDTPQRWNGSAATTSDWVATTGTVPTAGKYLTYFAERLWCLEGSRLRYSGITGSSPDPLNWDANNYVDLEPNDGQVGTGIGIIGSYLAVFKARKTYVIYDTITGANRQISNQMGCVAHRSIVQTPDGLLFLSEDQGICSTNGSTVTAFSDVIKPTLDTVASAPGAQALAAGTLLGRRYKLSLSIGGSRNDRVLEYDLLSKSWWLHDCATNQFALSDPGGTPILFSADSTTSARVSKAFVPEIYTDNGAKYAGTSYYISPYYVWGFSGSTRLQRYVDPHKVKRVREIRMDGVGNWESFVAVDFNDEFERMDEEVWESPSKLEEQFGGEGTFGGAGVFAPSGLAIVDRHFHTPALGRAVGLKYINDDPYNFRIYSQTIAFQTREN